MTEQMTLRGTLQGHAGWVTQIATTPQYPDMILSASRGRAWFVFIDIMTVDDLSVFRGITVVMYDCEISSI